MILETALISTLVLAPQIEDPSREDIRVMCEYEARVSHDTQILREEYPHWAQLVGDMRRVFKPGPGLQTVEEIVRNVYNSYKPDASPIEVGIKVYERCIDRRGTTL